MSEAFVEIGHFQARKAGQGADGDVFLSRKTEEGRIISVLSDGLGSGVKAGVLATLTATMAAEFIAQDIPLRRAAGIIMRTLPVCKVRKISYATFSIADIERSGEVRIIEYDNPPYALIRQGCLVEPVKSELEVRRSIRAGAPSPTARMRYSEFQARPGDRLLFFSDGAVQSGMGTRSRPLGWGLSALQDFVLRRLADEPGLSARALARSVVRAALANDAYSAKDDISCGVAYFREPRRLLLMTGPSVDRGRDPEMAHEFDRFAGRRIVAGGTTATILARELGLPVKLNLKEPDRSVPPPSEMPGAELVTEGIITLGRVAELLESPAELEASKPNPATRIVELLLDSDIIDFVVGTKINEAHQDPTMPVALEIRRNIVRRIASILESRHLKQTRLRFI